MLPGRLVWRFFLPCAALLLLATVGTAWLVSRRMVTLREEDQQQTLLSKARLLRDLALPALRGGDAAALQTQVRALGAQGVARLTVIRADRTVLADSEREDVRTISPHGLEREELREAAEGEHGSARRVSDTAGVETDYLALRVEDAGRLLGFVRTARRVVDTEAEAALVRRDVFAVAGAALLGGLLAAALLARRLSRPLRSLTRAATALAAGDTTQRVRGQGAVELRELAQAFNHMAGQLRQRLDTILAERRELQAILSGMVEGVLAVDGDERIVLMNEAGARILAVDPAGAVGRPLWEVVRLPEVTETLATALREGRSRGSEIRRPERPRDRVLRLHASPLVDPVQGPRGAVLVFHDITELRQLEQVRRDFVANASHELKTPLAAIRGLVETILDDEQMEPATQRRFLGSIQAQAGRLGDLVEEMLALSRLEGQGGASLPRAPLDLRDPVREALEALRPLARERGLRLEEDLGEAPRVVLAAAEPLRRIASNLIENALKYTPAGGSVRVRVLGEAGASEAGLGVLEVSDTGPGIAPAERERIFERFYRLDKGRGRDTGGTGLGLAIVKHLVAGLGGKVQVGDAEGGGALFRVLLPVP